MKIVTAVCALVFILLCKFYWLPQSSLEKKPVPLFPDPNNAFCELRPLTDLQRELLDFRPDCLHTVRNFSCYEGAAFPQKQTLRQTIRRRLFETFNNTPSTVPNASEIFKHDDPTQQPFLTVPHIGRHPPPIRQKQPQHTIGFPKNSYPVHKP